MLVLTEGKQRAINRPLYCQMAALTHFKTTNLAVEKILNGKEINSGPLGNGFIYPKFAWTLQISQADNEDGALPLDLVAKSCELPRWEIDTQVVNTYNHKTLVQTKLTYSPLAIIFYDQTNNLTESMIWNFVRGQFDPTDGSKRGNISPLTIVITMTNLSKDDGAVDKVYTLKNAFITDFQHDILDYSSSEPITWTITVRYEELETEQFKLPPPVIQKPPEPPMPPPPPPVTASKPKPDAAVDKLSKWQLAGGVVLKKNGETNETGAAVGFPHLQTRYQKARKARLRSQGEPQISASTGTNIPAKTPPARTLTKFQKDFIKKAEEDIKKEDNFKDEYKLNYIKYLKKNPPLSDRHSSIEGAERSARMRALVDGPNYRHHHVESNADGSKTYYSKFDNKGGLIYPESEQGYVKKLQIEREAKAKAASEFVGPPRPLTRTEKLIRDL